MLPSTSQSSLLRCYLTILMYISLLTMVLSSILTHCGLLTPYGDINLVNIGSGNGLVPSGTSHYPNQCWLISKVQSHSSECNFTRDTSTTSHWISLKITYLKFCSNLPGAKECMYVPGVAALSWLLCICSRLITNNMVMILTGCPVGESMVMT